MLGRKLGDYKASPPKLTFDSVHKNYLKRSKLKFNTKLVLNTVIGIAITTSVIIGVVMMRNDRSANDVKAAVNKTEAVAPVTEKPMPLSSAIGIVDSTRPITEEKILSSSVMSPAQRQPSHYDVTEEQKKIQSVPTQVQDKNRQIPATDLNKPAELTARSFKKDKTPLNTAEIAQPGAQEFKTVQSRKAQNNGQPVAKANPVKQVFAPAGNTEESQSRTKKPDKMVQNENREKAEVPDLVKSGETKLSSGLSTDNNGDRKTGLNQAIDIKGNKDNGAFLQKDIKEQDTVFKEKLADLNLPVAGNDPKEPLEAGPEGVKERRLANNNTGAVGSGSVVSSGSVAATKTVDENKAAPVKDDPAQTAVPAGDLSMDVLPPKKSSHFLISTELLYNNLQPKMENNGAYAVAGYDSALARSYKALPDKVFSGSVLLGYKYKKAGFNAGLGFLAAESQADTKGMSKSHNLYSLKVVQRIDSMGTHYDSTYVFAGVKNYNLVNGDTVTPQAYTNMVRFITIPLQFNYSFAALKDKLLIEPQLGIQIGIPLKATALVEEKPYIFSYSKNKLPLKKSFLFYDASLKINYRVHRNALIYLKQGYFFNSQSVYRNDYPLKYSLANLYTAFGLTVLLIK